MADSIFNDYGSNSNGTPGGGEVTVGGDNFNVSIATQGVNGGSDVDTAVFDGEVHGVLDGSAHTITPEVAIITFSDTGIASPISRPGSVTFELQNVGSGGDVAFLFFDENGNQIPTGNITTTLTNASGAQQFTVNGTTVAPTGAPGATVADASSIQFEVPAGVQIGRIQMSTINEPAAGVRYQIVDLSASTPICFTPFSLVLTSDGPKPIGELKVGEKLQTRDHGFQAVRWIYSRHLSVSELASRRQFKPVLIRKDSLGDGVPERDMLVSPGHMLLTTNRSALRAWKQSESLIPAQRLAGVLPGVEKVLPQEGVTYVHLLFDCHEIVKADGAWTESFRPSVASLAGLGTQRNEVYELFPELRHKDPGSIFAPARESFYSRRATRLAHRISRFGMLR